MGVLTQGCELAFHWGLESMLILRSRGQHQWADPGVEIKNTWVPALAPVLIWDPVSHHLWELGCHLLSNHKGKARWPFLCPYWSPTAGDQ